MRPNSARLTTRTHKHESGADPLRAHAAIGLHADAIARNAEPRMLDGSTSALASLPCRSCGYELAGLPHDSRCPECATAVADSLRAERIEFADPAWARRLTRGVALMAVGARLTAMTMLLTCGALLFGLLGGGPAFSIWLFLEVALFSTALLANVIGALIATSAEPRDRGREPLWSPRRCFRASAFVAIVTTVLIALCVRRNIPGTAIFGSVAAVASILFYLDRALVWLAALATRVRSRGLRASCLGLRRHWWIIVALFVVVIIFTIAVRSTRVSSAAAFLAWVPLFILLLLMIALGFRTAHRVAIVRRRLSERLRARQAPQPSLP